MDLMKSKLAGGKGMGRHMDISLINEDQHEEIDEIYLERV